MLGEIYHKKGRELDRFFINFFEVLYQIRWTQIMKQSN